MTEDAPWWKRGVVYQIYPRSFQDTNGDGVGDLEGIRRRLDHLVDLGVDAAWISPVFPSPMRDFGYDVADYCDIDPLFGDLGDMDRLLADAHARGLRVLLDLVPNHTSDEHPWFREARGSREAPKRDWYIWRDPAPDGGPPNNWVAYFGGPAWTLEPETGQYYLHQFLPGQPELNHRNPEVREAIHDAMRFWLARGVDGFRVDVLALMIKHEDFPDAGPNPDYVEGRDLPSFRDSHEFRQDRPEMAEVVAGMRAVTDEFEDRVLVGEIYLPLEELVKYYGHGCHLPFNFALIQLPAWTAAGVGELIRRYEAALPAGAWPNWVLGNHDQPRVASRVGPGQARVAQMLLLTLRGTPTLYYGDELGMTNVEIPRDRWRDPAGLRQPDFAAGSRDPERTPMQWDGSEGAGFAGVGVEPWLPLAPDAATRNVAAQTGDPASMLELTRDLLRLRRASAALSLGEIELIESGDEDLLAYRRSLGDEACVVVLNFTGEPKRAVLGPGEAVIAKSTVPGRQGMVDLSGVPLDADEGLVLVIGVGG